MKCEIIKDLLPAYCDCVCSAETAAEIEQHTQSCEDCKKLLENYRSDIKPAGGEPDKPFRRIKRSIFRNKLVISILAILLVVILCAVGYLTYGQIVRAYSPSFETVISAHRAKKLAEKICAGDIDSAMENIEIYQNRVALFANQEDVREHCRSVLADFYEKYLKGRDLNVKADLFHGYNQVMGESGMVSTTYIQILDGKTEILSFYMIERTAGKFLVISDRCSPALGDGCGAAADALDLALYPIQPTPLFETAVVSYTSEHPAYFKTYARLFGETPEEQQALEENADAITKIFNFEKPFCANFRFDPDNTRYLADIGFIFREISGGKRVVYYRTVQLKSSKYLFEILPEFEPVIIDDGISAESREKLENLFVINE